MKLYLATVMRLRKAVSELLVEILVIAVVIVMGFILIAWVYGLFNTLIPSSTKIQISQEISLIRYSDNVTIIMTIKNLGPDPLNITKVYIRELSDRCFNNTPLFSDNTNYLPSGEIKTLRISLGNPASCNIISGLDYTVVIVTNRDLVEVSAKARSV